jgi:predicted hydrocarbon binding protein
MAKHTEKWIKNLIASLDKLVDEETRKLIFERCGRECIGKRNVTKARKVFLKSENIEDFLYKYSKVNEHLHHEDDGVYLVYPKCYCPVVKNIPPGQLSATYCECSKGWAKELFEGATGRQVEVVREKTILSGDEECRFKIVF